jgi:hypothetical protein
MAALRGGLVLAQVRRDPEQLRIALRRRPVSHCALPSGDRTGWSERAEESGRGAMSSARAAD